MTQQKTDHHNLMMISTMIYVLTRKERKDNTSYRHQVSSVDANRYEQKDNF